MFGNCNIFSTQKCSFQQNCPDKSKENGNLCVLINIPHERILEIASLFVVYSAQDHA